MSQLETVIIEREAGVAIVTMNRPDQLNAFNADLRRDLREAVEQVNADESIRVAILTGAGRSFCAGADLTEKVAPDFRVEDQLNGEFKPILMAITEAPKPWISAVNGAAAGVGSAFAMVCDLTVMAGDAFLYQAFTAIGLVPDGGATWHLARALGRKRAYEMIVSGEKVSAKTCLALGLCNRTVAPEQLLPEAKSWAEELIGKAPLSLRYAKQSLNEAMEHSVGDTISNEAKLQHICITSDDSKEGVLAFMQKRAPQWKGG
ncbi:MAG: enoyl-CoA hydratase/isomerase family protein [Halieaceae bacterium]|jgi:2-(1,2-epoxy-1,2-dihydrophenyl)acetyl-CoA isomerase|nr:enoyl-CoA hydratase/isomerase family protein [Halieaceae bacterium]